MEGQRFYAVMPSIAINLMLILASMGAFALHRNQRARKGYTCGWASIFFCLVCRMGCCSARRFPAMALIAANTLLADPLIYIFTIMQIKFTFSFAGQRVGQIWRTYEIALLLMPILVLLEILGGVSERAYVRLRRS